MLVHVGQIALLIALYSQVQQSNGGHVFMQAVPAKLAYSFNVKCFYPPGSSQRQCLYQPSQPQPQQQQQQQQMTFYYGNQNIFQNTNQINSRIPPNQSVNTMGGYTTASNSPTSTTEATQGVGFGFLVTRRPPVQFNSGGNNCAPGVDCGK